MDLPRSRELEYRERQAIADLLSQGKKLAAIKYIRHRFDIPLMTAKRTVDQWSDSGSIGSFAATPRIADAMLEKKRGSAGLYGMLLATVILMGVGIGLLVGSYDAWSRNQQLIQFGERVEAHVTGLHSTGKRMTPRFEYVWNDDRYSWLSPVSSRPPAYDVGETAHVFVNPDDPLDILVDDFSHRWLLVLVLGLLGAGLNVAALVTFSCCYFVFKRIRP